MSAFLTVVYRGVAGLPNLPVVAGILPQGHENGRTAIVTYPEITPAIDKADCNWATGHILPAPHTPRPAASRRAHTRYCVLLHTSRVRAAIRAGISHDEIAVAW
jgi:hypothetical protein